MLPKVVRRFDMATTKTVVKELKALALRDDADGMAAREAVRFLKAIRLARVARRKEGGDELVQIVKSGRASRLVSDDVRFATRAESAGIPVIFSTALVYGLFRRGAISRDEGLAALERMKLGRGWEENSVCEAGRALFDMVGR
jgi:rRNA-processing protein FCF1